MVPEGVEFRDALPRTATDKIDRPRLVAETLDTATTRER
jgi:acyl-coenzyme A synthetase/AMP-(fatty) acid ligase